MFGISTLAVIEILSYKDSSIEEMFAIERWLRFLLVLDVDLSIARIAAELRKQYGLKTVDSVIAASALVSHWPLASRDRVFRKVKELNLIVL